MGLTIRAIEAAKYSGTDDEAARRQVLWDDSPRGLGLRLFPTGAKVYVLSYRNPAGRKRLYTIGEHGSPWTLEAARKEARRLLLDVEMHGIDPLDDRRQQRVVAKSGNIEAVFRSYVIARRTDPRRPMKRADDLLKLAEAHVFPRFGKRVWNDLKRSEVREWHGRMADTPHTANRALQALRAAYYWRLRQEDGSMKETRGRVPTDFRNPCAGVDLFPEQARKVRLELADLPRLEAALVKAAPDPFMLASFRFILLTGCRRSEALNLKWDDVDVSAKTATFRDVKAGGDHPIPLSAEALALLSALPRLKDNPHVFPGRKKGAPLVGVDKAWNRARVAAGLPHLRIHDLRRSVGSWLGDAGFTSKQIGEVLGHRSDITSRVYMTLGDATKRTAVDKVASLMREARTPKAQTRKARKARKAK